MSLSDSFPTEDAGGISIGDTRLILAGLVARSAAGVPRLGILPAHTSPLVTGTAGMAYSVAAFQAVTSRSGLGVELVANDGATSVATTAAPGSNSRIDVIWVRCRFATYSDGINTAEFGVTQGAAALTPLKPAIPSGALELATAVVLSTTTATSTTVITQTYLYTAAEGGTVLVRNSNELAAWAPHDGSSAFRLDTTTKFARVGGSWVRLVPQIGAVLRRSVDFALTAGAFVAVPFSVADVNDGPMWSAGAPTRFTAPVAGVYHFAGTMNQINSTGNGDITPRINGATNNIQFTVANSSGAALLTWAFDPYLSAGDYVEIFARTSGGSFPWIAGNRVSVALALAT